MATQMFKSLVDLFKYTRLQREHEKWKIEHEFTKSEHSLRNMEDLEEEMNKHLGYRYYTGKSSNE